LAIEIDGKPKDRIDVKIHDKFIEISDFIGAILYKEITKEEIKERLFPPKPKTIKSKTKIKNTIDIPQIIMSFLKNEKVIKKQKKKIDKKRITGMLILFGIVSIISLSLIYILNYIIIEILNIMEWWVLFILAIVFITPIALALAFFIAVGEY